jgi:hypothetical protein
MSSRDKSGTDPLDAFIGRCIKNWVDQYPLPQDGKEKLLSSAKNHSGKEGRSRDFFAPLYRRLIPALQSVLGTLIKSPHVSPEVRSITFIQSSGTYAFSSRQTMIQAFPSRIGMMGLIN